ncbi:MAG: HEPN domain-containing protein [Ignavibacteriales bacterium]|nr:HEPN domain-containing protein [Ignavibacteriales bacterium]
MAERRGRKTVERKSYLRYQNVAEHFYEAAKDSMDLEYWTAACVLIVHSAIAYTDALCIKLSGQRSIGDNHEDAILLVDTIVADSEEKVKAVNQLRRIIEEKTKVSYLGELYSGNQAKEMWKRLERFREWVKIILTR